MSEDKKKKFDPTEGIKRIAGLRGELNDIVASVKTKRIAMEEKFEYKELEEARRRMGEADKALAEATAEFKHRCEVIFGETEEKQFPGGQIKQMTSYQYDQAEAVKWAVEKEHLELLGLKVGKFKKMCAGLLPVFVDKVVTGKMYIDTDLSEYLQGGSDD